MAVLGRLAGVVVVAGAAGVVFLAGYACGRHHTIKAHAEARAKAEAEAAAQEKAQQQNNKPSRRDLGRPPTPSGQRLSNGWHRARSPCMSDVDSEFGDIGSPRQENYRMVLVVRMDLNMTKQKTGSLLCHAALGQFKKNYKKKNPDLWEWEHDGRSTVILRIPDEEGLNSLKESAKAVDIPTHTAIDRSGAYGSSVRAVIALGPAGTEAIGQITRHLQLW